MIKLILLLLILGGCGTTSLMRCDNLIGFEKDECIRVTELQQRSMLGVNERLMNDEMGRKK